MFNVEEIEEFTEDVQGISTTDPLLGGADGHLNQSAIALANRTKYLKSKIAELKEELTKVNENLSAIDGGTY